MSRSRATLLLLLASIPVFNVSAQQLINRSDSMQSLGESWSWAASQNEAEFWLAYRFNAELDERLTVAISSRDQDFIDWNQMHRNQWYGGWALNSPGWHNSYSLAALVSGATSMQQDLPQRKSLLMLAWFSAGEAEELRLIESERYVEWGNRPVYWLGDVSAEESFRHLIELFNLTIKPEFRRALVKSIGLHNSADRDAFLLALLSETDDVYLRGAIVEALAMQESVPVEAQLLEVAADENAHVLQRRVALSALSRYSGSESEELLLELAGALNPQAVRLEAIQSLALRPSAAAAQMLGDLITTDTNIAIIEQALVALSRQPNQFDRIAEAARNHRNADVREQALQLLTAINASAAFPVLREIVMTDSNTDVREEALEEMDQLPAELALPFLFQITDDPDTYSTDLRAEAVNTLSAFEAALVVDQLNRLAWGDSNGEVRENAVQSLGDLSSQNANALLLEIARNHPSRDTRGEAMEVLQDLVF